MIDRNSSGRRKLYVACAAPSSAIQIFVKQKKKKGPVIISRFIIRAASIQLWVNFL